MAKSQSSKKVIKSLTENLREVKAALEDTSDEIKSEAKEMINDLLENISDMSTDYEDSVIDYVTHQPLKSIGIAFLTGIFIGKVLL